MEVISVKYKKPDGTRLALRRMHTRQLLNLRDSLYAHSDVSLWYGMNFRMEDVKAELATREHVPNKREARAIRQARAQGHFPNYAPQTPRRLKKRSRKSPNSATSIR